MLNHIDEQDRITVPSDHGWQTIDADSERREPGDGVWIHVAAVYNGSHMIIYKNGVEVARMEKTGMIDQNPQVPVWIGSNPTVAISKPFDGIIDDVRVYDRALSPGEINRLASGLVD